LSIPIAIILNACRIAMIAILLERFQIDTTSGSAHALEGFAVFFVCIVLLFVVVSLLLRIGKPHGRLVAADILRFDRDSLHRLISWPLQRVSLLTGMVLVAGTSLIAILPARTEVIPQREPLALFPMEFAGWHGVPKTLDNESLDALSLTDYLLADYSGEASANVPLDFYVAYYASQRAGIHAHSPQLCIPAGGWSILRQSVVDVPLANGQSLSANRVVIEKHGARQIVYYWFEERGHHIATESSLKYYALRDALIDNRTDGALVRVVVPIHADEASADVMAKKLITDAMPRLRSFIPGQASR
jgi:EpsI family protein